MRLRPLFVTMTGSTLALTACPFEPPVDADPITSTGGSTGATTVEPGSTSDMPSSSGQPGSESGDGTTTAADSTSEGESSTGTVIECGNDVVEADEVCDGTDLGRETCATQGYDEGALQCTKDCAGFDTRSCVSFVCGNQTAEGSEQCDGNDVAGFSCLTEGFDSGDVSCNLDCTIDTGGCGTCGNVIVDGDEVCDDVALFGQTCESMGFDSGQLFCGADCLSYETTGCGTCGNGIIDGAEGCDMGDLAGATCVTAGFDSGTIGCDSASCAYETSGCGTCGNAVVDGDEECDDGNMGIQCLAGCVFCPGGGVIFEEDFSDNSAGWTLGTEWEIGPTISSVSPGACGSGDPEFDHTPTADNGIAGAVIGGNIDTALHDFYYLTSPPINTSGYTFLQLNFWRWLNSDYTRYMQNQIEVWNGLSWTVIWQSGPSPNVEDAAWENVFYDIAGYANDAMQVRIGYNIDSGGVYTCSGWNVDDLQIIGVTCPPPPP